VISSRRAGDCVTFRPRLDAQRKKSALPPAKAERPKNKRPGSEAGPEKAPWLRLQAATLYQRIAARGPEPGLEAREKRIDWLIPLCPCRTGRAAPWAAGSRSWE